MGDDKRIGNIGGINFLGLLLAMIIVGIGVSIVYGFTKLIVYGISLVGAA
jgi:hypothetical protein